METEHRPGSMEALEQRTGGVKVRHSPGTTIRRAATAISIVVGPLAVGIVRATIPALNPPNGKAAIAAVAAHPDMARVELAAGVIASIFIPFAIVGLTRLVMPRTPVFAMIGGVLALAGWALLPAQIALDVITYAMAGSNANHGQLASLLDQVTGNLAMGVLTAIFVIGHELGTLLLGVGLLRTRVVPQWAGVAVVVGILLHPVGFFLDLRPAEIVGFTLLVAGCVAAARAVLDGVSDTRDEAALA